MRGTALQGALPSLLLTEENRGFQRCADLPQGPTEPADLHQSVGLQRPAVLPAGCSPGLTRGDGPPACIRQGLGRKRAQRRHADLSRRTRTTGTGSQSSGGRAVPRSALGDPGLRGTRCGSGLRQREGTHTPPDRVRPVHTAQGPCRTQVTNSDAHLCGRRPPRPWDSCVGPPGSPGPRQLDTENSLSQGQRGHRGPPGG